MTVSRAICPQCRKEVTFAENAQYVRCPDCGTFVFNKSAPGVAAEEKAGFSPEWVAFFKAMVYVVVIIVGIIAIGVAVLFAGCVLAIGR